MTKLLRIIPSCKYFNFVVPGEIYKITEIWEDSEQYLLYNGNLQNYLITLCKIYDLNILEWEIIYD